MSTLNSGICRKEREDNLGSSSSKGGWRKKKNRTCPFPLFFLFYYIIHHYVVQPVRHARDRVRHLYIHLFQMFRCDWLFISLIVTFIRHVRIERFIYKWNVGITDGRTLYNIYFTVQIFFLFLQTSSTTTLLSLAIKKGTVILLLLLFTVYNWSSLQNISMKLSTFAQSII